jgi:O-antigen ligase
MYPTPILWLEIGIAATLGVAFLWTNPESALFLYGLALGFPDVALPLGNTVNVRLDDVLIVILLARSILWLPVPASRGQKNILMWQALFLAVCVLSAAAETASGAPPPGYESAKMAGCAVILLVLPRLVQSVKRLRCFVAGLACGGIALAIQIHQRLGENSQTSYANFQQLKSAATFDTWNPNTIGQAAILLVFAAALGAIVFADAHHCAILWAALAAGFTLLPVSVFVRGTSLSIAGGFLVFLCITRKWKWLLVFAAACLCALLYLHLRNPQLMREAAQINVTTGEGFSHRFDRWDMAFQAIQKDPWFGQGFGQEIVYLTRIGSEGRAHDAYLAVWLELGVGGLLILLGTLFQFLRSGWSLYLHPKFRLCGAVILSLIFVLCLDSVGLPTLYWEKLPTIALSLAVAVIGICERDGQRCAENVQSRVFAASQFLRT